MGLKGWLLIWEKLAHGKQGNSELILFCKVNEKSLPRFVQLLN